MPMSYPVHPSHRHDRPRGAARQQLLQWFEPIEKRAREGLIAGGDLETKDETTGAPWPHGDLARSGVAPRQDLPCESRFRKSYYTGP
jgi:hypothetical protein